MIQANSVGSHDRSVIPGNARDGLSDLLHPACAVEAKE